MDCKVCAYRNQIVEDGKGGYCPVFRSKDGVTCIAGVHEMKEAVYSKARELFKRRPDLKSEIKDIVEEMNDEIADGGSETHEAELALSDLANLDR